MEVEMDGSVTFMGAKSNRKIEVELHSFLTSAQNGTERSTAHHRHFTPGTITGTD
jgi:hypothetical protein